MLPRIMERMALLLLFSRQAVVSADLLASCGAADQRDMHRLGLTQPLSLTGIERLELADDVIDLRLAGIVPYAPWTGHAIEQVGIWRADLHGPFIAGCPFEVCHAFLP